MFPSIVKPTVSVDMQYAIGRKALRARDMDELVRSYRIAAAIMPADHIMVAGESSPARATTPWEHSPRAGGAPVQVHLVRVMDDHVLAELDVGRDHGPRTRSIGRC